MVKNKLYAATYVGDIEALQGKTALIRKEGEDETVILAQFDDFDVRYHGVGLAFNWHPFKKSDFKFRRGRVNVNESRFSPKET